jgi:hypothetical protein
LVRHPADGSEDDNVRAALLAEVEALRRRVAALEERPPGDAPREPPPPGRQTKRRTSTKTAVHLTTGAMLAMLAGAAIAYAADALIIGPGGSIDFPNRFGVLLTLWNPGYVIGIQPSTIYQRSGKNFAWYKGGQHTDTELDPGGGSKMMSLTDGNLDVAGSARMTGLNVAGSATMTGLNVAGSATMTGLNVAGSATVTGLKVAGLAVPASLEEVRIIRGTVDGINAFAMSGGGFTVKKREKGIFDISFTGKFGDTPAVIVSSVGGVDQQKGYTPDGFVSVVRHPNPLPIAFIWDLRSDGMTVKISDSSGNAKDSIFSFIALGK